MKRPRSKKPLEGAAKRRRRAKTFFSRRTRCGSANYTPPAPGQLAFAGSVLTEEGALLLRFVLQLDAPRQTGRHAHKTGRPARDVHLPGPL
jgi:hypothetical protein